MSLINTLAFAILTFIAGYQLGSEKITTNLLPVSNEGELFHLVVSSGLGIEQIIESNDEYVIPQCADCKDDCVSILCAGCGK